MLRKGEKRAEITTQQTRNDKGGAGESILPAQKLRAGHLHFYLSVPYSATAASLRFRNSM